jgi:hypothetical protein
MNDDWELDDLKFMEYSTLREFIDESQRSILLELWARRERADDEAFYREHCAGEGEDD